MSQRLVITEKPSVARDLAAALGGFQDHKEYWERDDLVISWAVGHLLELAEPQEYDKRFSSWAIKWLPILPEDFQLKPKEGQKQRLDVLGKLARRPGVKGLVNACDAGREGELIFRRIVQYLNLEVMPAERLWLRSMTPEAITSAFEALRPGPQFDHLADAAWLRSVGDWLVGINCTRALTQRLKSKNEQGSWSAGRVQTPTLNLLVDRERQILTHRPRPYWEVEATFTAIDSPAPPWRARYTQEARGEETEADAKPTRLFDRQVAEQIRAALQSPGSGAASEKRKKSHSAAPQLFDLTSLQRLANQRFSLSAKRTLDAAQRLYESHKVLTYPRTDSRHLPGDYGPRVGELLLSLADLPAGGPLGDLGPTARRVATEGPANLDRVLNDAKVSDHFAIIPTGTLPEATLTGDDARVYELVVRQFVAAFMGPATYAVVERWVSVPVPQLGAPARFRATSRTLEIPGYLEALGQQPSTEVALPPLVPGADQVADLPARASEPEVVESVTRPPARLSESQLLGLMEGAGKLLDDEELSEALRERGLGTPATRADTIERLVRGDSPYARRIAGRIGPTHKGLRLIDVLERVHADQLASPALTGEWERTLRRVEAGDLAKEKVLSELRDFTTQVTQLLTGFDYDDLFAESPPVGTCPACGAPVKENAWGYACEQGGRKGDCRFILWKDRFGRYIDRGLAERLLADRRVEDVEGFVDLSGRGYLKAAVALRHDAETDRWVMDVQLGQMEAGPEEIGDPLFRCPAHPDCSIVETSARYACQKLLSGEDRAGPQLPKRVCQREMALDEAEAFFGPEATTPLLDGFVSRKGRNFRASLNRKENGKHGFSFPERPARGPGSDAGPDEGGAEAAPTAEVKAAKPAGRAKKASPKSAPAADAKPRAATKSTSSAKASKSKRTETSEPVAAEPAAQAARKRTKPSPSSPTAKEATPAKPAPRPKATKKKEP